MPLCDCFLKQAELKLFYLRRISKFQRVQNVCIIVCLLIQHLRLPYFDDDHDSTEVKDFHNTLGMKRMLSLGYQPVDDESLSLSSHLSLTGSLSSSSSSILSLCITPSLFHSSLKTYLFHKSFPHQSSLPFRLISRIL